VAFTSKLKRIGNRTLRGRETGNWHPERRARHIGEPTLSDKGDGFRITTMLAADR
jgi:hypothetical protein